jgi:zinc transport system ATP-binding protein
MSTALDVAHLTVAFGRTEILRDVSFRVDSGTTLAIIGPNGSGKTVLLKALVGAVPATGTVRWAPGTTIGYVPQKLDIERDLPLTGLDFLRAKRDVSGAARSETARVLALVDLPVDTAARPMGTLSGGHFQRLLLAFALMGRPAVLLFDEPTAGIDEPGQEGIYALFRRLQEEEGLTLILISHELSLVYRHADSVLCLSRRRPCFGPPLEILTPERLQEAYGTAMKFHVHDAGG